MAHMFKPGEEVLCSESQRRTSVQWFLNHRDLQLVDLQTYRGILHIVQLRVETCEACPQGTDPSFGAHGEVSRFVDNAVE